MSTGEQKSAAPATTTQEVSELDKIYQLMPKSVESTRKQSLIDNIIKKAMEGVVTVDKDVVRTIEGAIKQIDAKMSKQLAEVMHHPAFQKLEGTWRGLRHLVFSSETCATLKLKVMNVSKDALRKDLEKALEFDQSHLFKKLYEDEFGIAGGEPYGALIGDYEFKNHPEDIDLLSKISEVAAGAFCPFISAASHEMFELSSFSELSKPRDLEKTFLSESYIKWRSFRASEDSRFVVLTMPRVLSRLPYGKNTKSVEEFGYEEVELDEKGNAKPVPHDHYTWMNSAYVYGANMTGAFSRTNWCTAIRGVENGGKVEGLPVHVFKSDDGDLDAKCPTEVGITDRRSAELDKLGFLPLCHFKNTDYSVFFGGQSTQKPKEYDTPDATANAAISARLPYIMASSRIAHFLKVIGRDKIGSFLERQDMEDFLKRWIGQYILADAKASAEMKAKFPLAEAKISVEEVPGKPGYYQAVAHLRPWLQFEDLTASLRMVAAIPKKQ